jgi:hypothetical protein
VRTMTREVLSRGPRCSAPGSWEFRHCTRLNAPNRCQIEYERTGAVLAQGAVVVYETIAQTTTAESKHEQA